MLGEPLCRGDRTLVAFAARPCFRLPHELAQLAEHDRGIRTRSVERIDALEPGQDGARFLHANDATGGGVSACAQLCNAFATSYVTWSSTATAWSRARGHAAAAKTAAAQTSVAKAHP
jgi:hypothetical protein